MKLKSGITAGIIMLMFLLATETSYAATSMQKQGNPTSFNLNTIAENKDNRLWIKVSTQYDPELSMFDYTSMPEGTKAIAVTFDISDFDQEASLMYWCYQLKGGDYSDKSLSVWDNTSPTDQLTITSDGRYVLVFDAKKALNGELTLIESLQMVFECKDLDATSTTATGFSCVDVECITDENELANYVTGKVEKPEATPTQAAAKGSVESAATVETTDGEDTEKGSSYYMIITIVGAFIVILILMTLIVRRKKKQRKY
jgi:hypothetical protein